MVTITLIFKNINLGSSLETYLIYTIRLETTVKIIYNIKHINLHEKINKSDCLHMYVIITI